ncbi:RNA-binding domain-containing protein [Nanobdella aerobiophila]|nr:RNA-binding domain-containing protein [Nanobdella aerobiophila]
MKISKIYLRLIVHDWDDRNIIDKLKNVFISGIDRKYIKETYSKDKGLISNNLIIYELTLTNKNAIDILFSNLIYHGLNIDDIINNSNFDENCNLYLRIDKDYIKDYIIRIRYSDNSILLKISFDDYNKNKDKIYNFIKEYFGYINKKFLDINIQ